MFVESPITNKSDDLVVPVDIEGSARKANLEILPKKSVQQYDIAYNNFLAWCKLKNVEGNFSEPVFLAYLEEKSKIWSSSTLWIKFSIIKSSALIENGVDVSKYFEVIAYLKRKSEGYRPKKSKIHRNAILTWSIIPVSLKCTLVPDRMEISFAYQPHKN